MQIGRYIAARLWQCQCNLHGVLFAGLNTDQRFLNSLCSVVQNDIRSCLNALQVTCLEGVICSLLNLLQFLNKDSLGRERLVSAGTVAQKDVSQSVMSVLELVFRRKKAVRFHAPSATQRGAGTAHFFQGRCLTISRSVSRSKE